MSTLNLIVLSYHKFVEEESDYPFSRTYEQFRHDLRKKEFDMICIDDAHKSIIKACAMMQELNYRAKIFVSTSLVGDKSHCSWGELEELSRFHDIENHSHEHVNLTELNEDHIYFNIDFCSKFIHGYICKKPRFFVPPFNTFDERVERIAGELGLQLIKDRITIKNDTK